MVRCGWSVLILVDGVAEDPSCQEQASVCFGSKAAISNGLNRCPLAGSAEQAWQWLSRGHYGPAAVGRKRLSCTISSNLIRTLGGTLLARSEGFEPPTFGFEARRSIRLS